MSGTRASRFESTSAGARLRGGDVGERQTRGGLQVRACGIAPAIHSPEAKGARTRREDA
jgi:hypothetical protein